MLKYILKLHKKYVVIIERLENATKDFQLKMTGWTRTLFSETPLKWQQEILLKYLKPQGQREQERWQQRLEAGSRAQTLNSTDTESCILNPSRYIHAAGLTLGTPKKAQALQEVDGAENREQLDPLVSSPGAILPPPPTWAED